MMLKDSLVDQGKSNNNYRSEVEIEKEIALLTDEDEILYHKLKSIKQELHQKYKEVK